jgi:hypothetical protein
VKRGCRSLFKQGDKKSLAAFNYTKDVRIGVRKFQLQPESIRIGEAIAFQFELISKKSTPQKLMVDYCIHYVKKTGKALPKVFKLKELQLAPGASEFISKKQRFQDFTTRKHFPGKHTLEIVVNGKVVKRAVFTVSAKKKE